MFYESSGRKEDALKIFRDQTSSDVKVREEFSRHTQRILLRVTDKQIMFKYSQWVLSSFPEIGLEIFTHTEEQHHISYDVILEHLSKYNYQVSLVELYLRWLVEVKQVDTERSILAWLFAISKSFSQCCLSKAERKACRKALITALFQIQKNFKNILESSKNYHAKTILEAIDKICMIEAEVLLLSKERKHSEGLNILVVDGIAKGDFTRARNIALITVRIYYLSY